jgi:hypothetical protein
MKLMKAMALVIAALSVSACAGAPPQPYASRNAPADLPAQEIAARPTSFNVQHVRVNVPKTLRVSEANRFYPGGDIVWREDPLGDRHAQVKTIFEGAMLKGVREMGPREGVPVLLDIEVTRFHALTEKARYTVGGVHALQFYMTLRDPETGKPYGAPQFVKADFKALGGRAAVRAEAAGLTQKKRITDQLSGVIQKELTNPGSYEAAGTGLLGALNQIH